MSQLFVSRRWLHLWLLIALGLAFWPRPALARALSAPIPSAGASTDPSPAFPSGVHAACLPDGKQASGAFYRICMPPNIDAWNHELVVYAHGYVDPNLPVVIPEGQLHLPDGTSIPDAITGLNYAFATTSYRANGLVVREGIADLAELVGIFKTAHPDTTRVYLVGASEGGLITTLSVEKYSSLYAGGLAVCGPIGDFLRQIDYFSDFRVLFDYFFPGILPGSAIAIPQAVMDEWDPVYVPRITAVLRDPANAGLVAQLLATTHAPYIQSDPTTIETSTIQALWYNVFATNNARLKLGGNPYDNHDRLYVGSADDARLNRMVARFSADSGAVAVVNASYQTSGRPLVPLVTVHTTLDPQVPYWHEVLYRAKVITQDRLGRHDMVTVQGYGHCSVPTLQIVSALYLLQARVANPPPLTPSLHLYAPHAAR